MKNLGAFFLAAIIIILNSCTFLSPNDATSDEPLFLFSPKDSSQSANFLLVHSNTLNNNAPFVANRHCSIESRTSELNNTCWFFPIMRMY